MSIETTGVLKTNKRGHHVLRQPAHSLLANGDDVLVPDTMVQEFMMVDGVTVHGELGENGNRKELATVNTLSGLYPRDFQARTPYANLVAVSPEEPFGLGKAGDPDMRIIDLIAPIGKGTRGLIVSPPRAGKTMLLKKICLALEASYPDTRVIIFLIDERPEEVTDFRRSVKAEVLASTSDQSSEEQVELTELLLAHIRTELECGRDVVVLVDSLTRMGRAFNLRGSGTRRTMSGGMEAGAMEIPRRFFGLARNIENGGSVTIIATALVNTGSRMDEVIFEEFKGTGNSEIILDRRLAEMRLYPAINVVKSGTRREELLLGAQRSEKLHKLRRVLAGHKPRQALEKLLKLIKRFPTNEELLERIPKS